MRTAQLHRETRETQVDVRLNLDGTGQYKIDTGVGFLDHMLIALARHARFDLTVDAAGDLLDVVYDWDRLAPPASLAWFEQKWADKLAAGFTNSGSQNGDKQNTLVDIATFAAQHGMVWINSC